LDEGTQLLLAGWLKAHSIHPFDTQTDVGKERWQRVLEAARNTRLLKDGAKDGSENDSIISEFEVLGSEFEVLGWVQDTIGQKEWSPPAVGKEWAMLFVESHHEFAKASDYIENEFLV